MKTLTASFKYVKFLISTLIKGEKQMALSLMDVEMLTDIAIKTAKGAWEKSFSQRKYSLLPKVKAAKIKVIGKIASEILEHWLEEGIHPNNLEAGGIKDTKKIRKKE